MQHNLNTTDAKDTVMFGWRRVRNKKVEQKHNRNRRYTFILEILTDFLACIRCDPSFIPRLLKYFMQWRGNEVCGVGRLSGLE